MFVDLCWCPGASELIGPLSQAVCPTVAGSANPLMLYKLLQWRRNRLGPNERYIEHAEIEAVLKADYQEFLAR